MRMAIHEKYGLDFEDDNVADAYALARFLLCFGEDAVKFCVKGAAVIIRRLRDKENYDIK